MQGRTEGSQEGRRKSWRSAAMTDWFLVGNGGMGLLGLPKGDLKGLS